MAKRLLTIAVVGIDGAGKTNICRELQNRVNRFGLRCDTVGRWDVLDREKHYPCRFLNQDLPLLKECIGELDGDGRALFLFSLLAIAHRRQSIGFDLLIFDGYWAKHAAAELVLGSSEDLIKSSVLCFPKADLTLLLDLDPKIAASRKFAEGLNSYECGLKSEISEENFIEHQKKVREILQKWAITNNWYRLDASKAFNEIFEEIWIIIKNLLIEFQIA